MRASRFALLLFLLIAATTVKAGTVPFNFESMQPSSGQGEYESLDIAANWIFVSITRPGARFDIKDHSQFPGGLPLFGFRSISPFFQPTSNTPLIINFSYPLIAASIDMGDYDIDTDTLSLKAYSGVGGTGRLLGTATGTLPGSTNFSYATLSLQSAGIRSLVVIGGSASQRNSVFYDNLKIIVAANPNDFDGDRQADFSVFRPSAGTWYALLSTYFPPYLRIQQFGISTDRIVPGDYDGDDWTDMAVFRNGIWYIWQSLNNTLRAEQFGLASDKPVPADYDGDGKTDIAVFRPSSGDWYIINSSNNLFRAYQFGQSGDVPLPSDYGIDGRADVAVFRPSNGTWYYLSSFDGAFNAGQFGLNGDKPVPADYDGDGTTDLAVFRGGIWYISQSSNGAILARQWGLASDIPVPADYDDSANKAGNPDGKASIAVFRPSNGTWYVLSTQDASVIYQQWGTTGDSPIPSSYPSP